MKIRVTTRFATKIKEDQSMQLDIQNATLRLVLGELSDRWGITLINRRTGEMKIGYVVAVDGMVCQPGKLDDELTDKSEVEITFIEMMVGG